MTNQLDNIVVLHGLVEKLETTAAALDGIPEWMSELHGEHSGWLERIAALEAAVEEERRQRRAAEVTIEEAQERLKRFQQQINLVSNQREYGALLHEIDAAKAQIATAEETGLAAMERREEAEGKLEEARQAFADLDQRYHAELTRWEAEKPSLAALVKDLEADIEALRQRLPRPIVAQYDRVRERHQGQALALIREMERLAAGSRIYHCSACNYRVRPQAVVEIRSNGALVLCDSCKRILHLAPVESV